MAKWKTKTNQEWQNICELIQQLQNVRLRRTIGELSEQHRFYTVKYSIQPQLTQVTVKLNSPVSYFLQNPLGNHHILIKGNHTEAIQEFMDAGGHVMILLGQTQNAQPNLDALLKTYGMQRQTGYIADTERYYSSPYDIFPELYAGTVVSQDLTSDALILIYNAVGMVKTDPANENVTLSTVMQTGSNGYLVTEDSQTQG